MNHMPGTILMLKCSRTWDRPHEQQHLHAVLRLPPEQVAECHVLVAITHQVDGVEHGPSVEVEPLGLGYGVVDVAPALTVPVAGVVSHEPTTKIQEATDVGGGDENSRQRRQGRKGVRHGAGW